MRAGTLKPEEHFINDEPYYKSVANEVEIFYAAYRNQLPVLLKGPAGCGKTRFVEHMAWRLKQPLITAIAHLNDLDALYSAAKNHGGGGLPFNDAAGAHVFCM